MDAHFITIPGLATLTTRSLAGGNAQNLGGHAGRPSNFDGLLGGLIDDITAGYINGAPVVSMYEVPNFEFKKAYPVQRP